MQLEHAKRLKYGQRVACPADRGDSAFVGTVSTQGLDLAQTHKNSAGVEYIWIEVLRPGYHKSVWPSNRLGSV